MLVLGDLEGSSLTEIKKYITENFEITLEQLDEYLLEVVFMSSKNYEGKAYMLMRHKENQKWYEVNAWHCSCYGFEHQFEPDETLLDSILIRKEIVNYRYDDNTIGEDDVKILDHVKKLRMGDEIDNAMRNLQ